MKRIGIVGAGAIAQAYLNVLNGSDFATVSAIADVRADAVKAAAEIARCQGFTSYQEMAENAELDAVIICTPPDTHPEIAVFFLNRGVAVLCEKPWAISIEGAQEIAAAGQRNARLVTMASKFRYVEDVIRLRSIIASGLLGHVLLVENAFVAPVDMSSRWNSQPGVSGGGVVIDNGTHSIDILRYLLGPIREILAVPSTCTDGLKVEDNASLFCRTNDGVEARVDLSWTFDKQLSNFISVFGTHGTAHVGWRESRYKQRSSSDWIIFGSGYDKIAAFRNNVRNFCGALDGTEMPLISASDALASVHVIQAAYASAENKRWETVHDSGIEAMPLRARKSAGAN
jgi:predicted dehydrogenase